ncbi:hypothetical protein J3R30DRAFT_3382377 [Lentinula aciculospora]|uniref:Uncharacterized protein n=1 Tax=Lentinula aciculospora TaxID=153920 RepID=A0A9W8ZYF6_9AGAR|nr:hypothetical protein J3R30DRAFT_3382377 [Lentinula aciculospora]
MPASYTSPSCYLMWALLSCTLGVFLLYHLYSFDKFRCLKWNDGPYSGAFKRVMTYSYFLTIPLFMVYAVGFAVIKYQEGYTVLPSAGIVPMPYEMWSSTSRALNFPLMLCFATAWGLEMVTHLQELCFWLFLVNANTGQKDWFRSHYFKIWVVGSMSAIIYMPSIAICTHENALRASDSILSEAIIFLAGSLGSLIPTILFMPILRKFPLLLDNLTAEGVDNPTIIRLTKFHELNTIRVIFRYLFTVPLLILGIDGVCSQPRINGSAFWTDLFAFTAAIGCTASSGITLVIFFPRSAEIEVSTQNAGKHEVCGPNPKASRSSDASLGKPSNLDFSSEQFVMTMSPTAIGERPTINRPSPIRPNRRRDYDVELGGIGSAPPHYDIPSAPSMQPNRKCGNEVELGGISSPPSTAHSFADLEPSGYINHSHMNPIIYSYTSPISCVLVHFLIYHGLTMVLQTLDPDILGR